MESTLQLPEVLKKASKSFSIALLVLLALSFSPPVFAATVALGEATANPGQSQVALPLSLAVGSGEQISAFSVDVYFDSAVVSWQSVTLEPSLTALGKEVQTNVIAPGHVRMVIYGMDQQIFSNGLLGQCMLQVLNSAAAGSTTLNLQSGLGSSPTGAESVLSLSDGRIWIEDTSSGDPFVESGGQVVIEAEHYSIKNARGGADWVPATTQVGASGNYLEAAPNNGLNINTNYVSTSPELVYKVNFTTPGTYRVWMRGVGPTDSDDSAHVGIDGAAVSTADRISGFGTDWTWTQDTMDGPTATIIVSAAGLHTIHVWMREDGFLFDRLLLTTGSSVPSGVGPAESLRSVSATPPPPLADTTPPIISAVAVGNVTQTAAAITWTTDEPASSQVEYGATIAYGQTTVLDSTLTTSHTVNLSGLNAGAAYHFRVLSSDAAGNNAVGSDGTFTTAALVPVATPTITPSGGTFSGSVSVTLATATSAAEIRYTTDGSTPTASSTLYSGSFTLNTSATVKALALKSGMANSAVASVSFTVNPVVVTPLSTITLLPTQTTAASTNWTTSGTERYSWMAPAWLEYRVDFGSQAGTWLGAVTAINYKGNLPPGYAFNIDIYVDGGYKGAIKISGSSTIAKTGSRIFTMPAGVHTVRFVWTNDYWTANKYDANIRVQSVTLTPQ